MLDEVVREVTLICEVKFSYVPVPHRRHILEHLHGTSHQLINVLVLKGIRCLWVLLVILLCFLGQGLREGTTLSKASTEHELISTVEGKEAATVAKNDLTAWVEGHFAA